MDSPKPQELISLLEPDKCALLVVDKQEGYIGSDQPLIKLRNTNTEQLKKIMTQLDIFIDEARRINIPVIWTKMVENVDESPANISLKMRIGNTPSVIKSTDKSFEIYGHARPKQDEKVIIKKRFDAFIGTDLDEHLKKNQRSTLVLTGGYASRCLLATSFVGNSLGYNIAWAKDLVGVPDIFMKELPIAIGIVDSILGYTFESSELLSVWKNQLGVI